METNSRKKFESEEIQNRFIVFGDSNAGCFHKFIKNVQIFAMASAKGLGNPFSKTFTNNKIKYECSINKYSGHIFYFGKVDIEFILTHVLNTRPNIDLQEYIEKILLNYQCFIKELNKNSIYICELPTSHLTDTSLLVANNCSWNFDVANDHLEKKIVPEKYSIVVPFDKRNEYIYYFNNKMRMFCQENGYTFLEINKHFMDNNKNYKIPDEYRNEDINDHHLAEVPIGILYVNEILSLYSTI